MEEARVQPVPCVWVVSTCLEVKISHSPVSPQHRTSVASCASLLSLTPAASCTPLRCPPFTSTYLGPMAQRSRAACFMASTVSILLPPKRSVASWRFGVMMVARGNSSFLTLSIAGFSSRTWPLDETITGSMTSRRRQRSAAPTSSWSAVATQATISEVASMPVLITSVPMSSRTTAICCRTKSMGMGKMPWTPTEFCAVRAAIAVVLKAPRAAQAFTSAWMPAPPPLSEPATMSTRGGTTLAARRRGMPAPALSTPACWEKKASSSSMASR
mmetsp:Transcript_64695/g.169417  ORF Transcript_64695/g.169417 Transcript_64695/m.169417 type:complete len:272 (-) Transcript_64695:208-1023(-)